MKLVSFAILTLAVAISSTALGAPVSARYVKFEGYYSSQDGQIGIHELEVYSKGVNIARGAAVTANSIFQNGLVWINDGDINAGYASNPSDPGPASEVTPHWVQMDFGAPKPIDQIKVYLYFQTTFSLSVSSDGENWTQVRRYDLVSGVVENAPSAPWVLIESAAMQPGTTFMDVTYRVKDIDDAAVKTRALAFVDGVRSFANVIKPVTFDGDTSATLGDAIATNVSHTLTWDVATDWDIDLGQIKFEVLARDGRGLLPLDWITIPAAGGHPQTTVSKNSPTNAEVLNALFWQYADGDTGLSLANGILSGNVSSGAFNNVTLANGATLQTYATPYIFKLMNRDLDDGVVATAARAGLTTPQGWHAASRDYAGVVIINSWGINNFGQVTAPAGLCNATSIAAGANHNLALISNGTVVGWGANNSGQISIPAGLSGVTAVDAGAEYSLALKSDGSVVGWGNNANGQTDIPIGLTGVAAIAAGGYHGLALKSDGTVVGWGYNVYGQATVPAGLSGVIAIAAGLEHSLALKSDGTVIAWGRNASGESNVPTNLSDITAIAAGSGYSLALKNNGTLVGWGINNYGQIAIPVGLSGVVSIDATGSHSLALKSDGNVVGWGKNTVSQATIPLGLTGVAAIAAGGNHSVTLKAKAP